MRIVGEPTVGIFSSNPLKVAGWNGYRCQTGLGELVDHVVLERQEPNVDIGSKL